VFNTNRIAKEIKIKYKTGKDTMKEVRFSRGISSDCNCGNSISGGKIFTDYIHTLGKIIEFGFVFVAFEASDDHLLDKHHFFFLCFPPTWSDLAGIIRAREKKIFSWPIGVKMKLYFPFGRGAFFFIVIAGLNPPLLAS
jgi:hypothetical protein